MLTVYHSRNRHIPPNYVVERFVCSSKAARGEDLQVEHPVCGGQSSAFHFHPALPHMLGTPRYRMKLYKWASPVRNACWLPRG
jgi:hypothetical protein